MPGFTPRAFKQVWNMRLAVTNSSFHSMVKNCITHFERKPIVIRRMYDRRSLEDRAMQASTIHALAAELLADVPIEDGYKKVREAVILPWEDGDMNLDVQLMSAIAEKATNFGWSDIEALRNLAQEHTGKVGRY